MRHKLVRRRMITGVILAAGASKRMGVPKQTLQLSGRPMLQRVVDTFLSTSLDEVIVVLSPALRWRPEPRKRLRLVLNPLSGQGISTSVRAALDSIDPKSEAVIIGLGDKPLLRRSTIEKLIEAHRRSISEIIIPTYRGERGNPILFRRGTYPGLSRLRGDVGARTLIGRKDYSPTELPVRDAGILLDVDRPADLLAARRILSSRRRLAAVGKSRK